MPTGQRRTVCAERVSRQAGRLLGWLAPRRPYYMRRKTKRALPWLPARRDAAWRSSCRHQQHPTGAVQTRQRDAKQLSEAWWRLVTDRQADSCQTAHPSSLPSTNGKIRSAIINRPLSVSLLQWDWLQPRITAYFTRIACHRLLRYFL